MGTRLALGTGLPVLIPHYRMAPEHPFPAANEDALAAYRALRAGGTPADRIVLAGDSAGGGMALALAMTVRQQGESPRCLALIEPWVDLSEDAAWRTASPCGDGLLTPPDIADFAQQYVGGSSTDPAASPVRRDQADVQDRRGRADGQVQASNLHGADQSTVTMRTMPSAT